MAKRKKHGINFKYMFKHGIDAECDDLLKFIETMASGLKSERENFESFLDRMTEGLDEDRKSEAVEFYGDDAFGLLERYPTILWQSVFISLYSFFEQEMNRICVRVRRAAAKNNVHKTPIAKTTDVTLPAQKCLAEFRIRLATKSAAWKRMTEYVGVRNLIVHNRGQLRKDDYESDRVRKFVRYARHIKFNHRKQLVLEEAFCVNMVETMRGVLYQVIGAIPHRLFHFS